MEEIEKMEDSETSQASEKKVEDARLKAQRVLNDFHRAKRKIGDRISEHIENMAFYEGKQYQLSKYKTSRPWVVRMRTPHAKVAIDTRVSSIVSNDYRGDLLPMAPEHEKMVQILNDFKNDEWERLELNTTVKKAIKASAIVREAYVHVIYDEDDECLKAYLIDTPSSIYIDPNALALREARYMCVVSRLSKEDALEMYPEFGLAFQKVGSQLTPEDRGEAYLGTDYQTEQHDVLTQVVQYKRVGKKIMKYTVIEDILVEEDELTGLKHFPIAQMRWSASAGNCYGLSLMDDLIDSQKAINAIESAITNTAIAYSSPSYGVRKGSGVNAKELAVAIGAPGMVITVEGDIKNAIQALNLPQLDQSIVAVMNEYISTIDRIAGISNPYLGSVGTAGNTSGGTKMALERARIIENDVMENIKVFIEDLTHILIDYLIANYSGMELTSRKVDSTTGSVKFNKRKLPKNLDEAKYSFFINLNSKTTYSKEREKEVVLELYQMQHQYGDKIKLLTQLDILEAYDLPNKESLVARYMQLAQQTDEATSQIIVELVQNASSLGMNMEVVQQAIVELMSGVDKTPVYDKLIQEMKTVAQQQAQLRQQTMEQFKQEVTQAGVPEQAIASAEQAIMPQ